jgi:uncharacterized membrane protein required for colicin V production
MNILDIVIILAVGALVVTGYFGGFGRVTAGCFAVYFSTIVAAAFYEPVGRSIGDGIGELSTATASLVAFLLLFIVMTAGFFWVIWQTFRSLANERSRFPILDNMGGAALAIVVGMLTIAMTLSVTVILLGALNQSSTVGTTQNLGALGRQIRESELVPMFLKLQPTITSSLEPWFPNGLPEILRTPPTV